jgi:hypothetical protein
LRGALEIQAGHIIQIPPFLAGHFLTPKVVARAARNLSRT